jgi:hypothetical protein
MEGEKRYVRRQKGKFSTRQSNVGRSLSADRRSKAKTIGGDQARHCRDVSAGLPLRHIRGKATSSDCLIARKDGKKVGSTAGRAMI